VVVADVSSGGGRATPYTRWGDWFPPALAALLGLVAAAGIIGRDRPARGR
jgi:apolipoprotein N-acyltransferase